MADKPKKGMSDLTFLFYIIGFLFGVWVLWVFLGGPQEYNKKDSPFLAPPVGDLEIKN